MRGMRKGLVSMSCERLHMQHRGTVTAIRLIFKMSSPFNAYTDAFVSGCEEMRRAVCGGSVTYFVSSRAHLST